MVGQISFFRSFVAEFGNVKIDGTAGADDTLRVEFLVERDKLFFPNCAELRVTNLSADTRAQLTAAGPVTARISAGYDADPSVIFFGVLDHCEHVKDGSSGDWTTRLSSSDGARHIKETGVSKSFAKGTTVATIIKEILKSLHLGEGNIKDFANDSDMLRILNAGASVFGNAAEELTYWLRSAGLEFSIQNSKIQFTKIGRGAPNTEGPLLTPDTGLVGSVTLSRERCTDLTRKGPKKRKTEDQIADVLAGKSDDDDTVQVIEGTCLLNPKLVPGVPFRVESATVTGDFLCCAIRHRGDSRGNDWFTEFHGIPLL